MASLHARKKLYSLEDEEMLMMQIQTADPQNKKKRKGIAEMQAGFVTVALFTIVGFALGYLLLHHQHRKVILHVIRNPWAHGGAALLMATTRRRHTAAGFHHHFYSDSPRFVTVVMPSVVNPSGRRQRLEAIHDTWGPYARAIYVLHNINEFPQATHLTMSDDSHPTDKYSYPQNLLLPTYIRVEDGLSRLYHTIRAIYKRVNPDFAFFVNDHTYVIPSHLCHYLDNQRPEYDLYAGHALKNDQALFNSGAAGYLLSRETMRKLIQKFDDKDPKCWIDDEAQIANKQWLQDNPGLITMDCLRSMGITAFDTREKHKYHRFHAFPITRVVAGRVDDWYTRKHKLDDLPEEVRAGFDSTYTTLLNGEDCCSSDTISFHYVESKESKAIFAVWHALLNKAHMSDSELKNLMMEVWPTEASEIGFYSRGLPPTAKEQAWSALLKTMRKISTKETEKDC